jgi:hypothetical protein
MRLDAETDDAPWLTVCSFLNPHDDSMFGLIALTQGLVPGYRAPSVSIPSR